MKDKKQDSGLDGREIPLLIMLIGGASWYKYGGLVQIWFHLHLVEVVLGAAGVLTICGYIVLRRYLKKNEEQIARMKRLRDAKAPAHSPDRYYQRRASEFDHE